VVYQPNQSGSIDILDTSESSPAHNILEFMKT